jgi:hypothetical protein
LIIVEERFLFFPRDKDFFSSGKIQTMQNWLRTIIAGYGASKLGGGCLGTILIFFLLYWLLGYMNC